MDSINEIADRLRYFDSIFNEQEKAEHLSKWQQNRDDEMRTEALKRFGVTESSVQKPSREEVKVFIDCAKRMGVRFIP